MDFTLKIIVVQFFLISFSSFDGSLKYGREAETAERVANSIIFVQKRWEKSLSSISRYGSDKMH